MDVGSQSDMKNRDVGRASAHGNPEVDASGYKESVTRGKIYGT